MLLFISPTNNYNGPHPYDFLTLTKTLPNHFSTACTSSNATTVPTYPSGRTNTIAPVAVSTPYVPYKSFAPPTGPCILISATSLTQGGRSAHSNARVVNGCRITSSTVDAGKAGIVAVQRCVKVVLEMEWVEKWMRSGVVKTKMR